MDPITGLAALAGISLATVAGLRLNQKKQREGFRVLPDRTTDYPQSTEQSQTRYNMFSGLVNPITNAVIPVGSSDKTIRDQTELVNNALGSWSADFAPDNKLNLVLREFQNKNKPRVDSQKSLYGAAKFCRDAAKGRSPFTQYNPDGSVKVQGAVSKDGYWKFDEVCGVCLSDGIDEDGNRFRTPQGMLLESSQREEASNEQQKNGWSYARAAPSIGSCNGAPANPVFATNAKDLERFRARDACLHGKTIGGPNSCALCYDSDGVFSSVPATTEVYPVYFTLQGVGSVTLRIQGNIIHQGTLSESSPLTVELVKSKEGDSFHIEVVPVQGRESATNVFGYLHSKNPRDGIFTMPLNLLATIDDETGTSPSKSGGFFTFTSLGLDVAKIRPGAGKESMRLRGIIPFTFVQPSEFPAMDCLDNPYQKLPSSASAFSTDQPCFAKGSKPGNYNDACLRARILDAGCTNAGDLFKNPRTLNVKNGVPQTLSQLYATLQEIVSLDMVDPAATKQCSGRSITTPCDPFIARAGTMKFGDSLKSANSTVRNQASQCLSFLYNNRGANETATPPRVGPTYSNLSSYSNDRGDVKNSFCLPEGALNPDVSSSGKETLARIADAGYKGKIGVDALKIFLTEQLSLATDTMRNANTDPERKAAILNCFGRSLKNLPSAAMGSPRVVTNPCGVLAQFVRVLPSTRISDSYIEISQLVVIDKDGKNVALGKSTAGSSSSFPPHGLGTHGASFAIDGQIYPKSQNFYISAQPGGNSQFLLNLGKLTDITKIIYITRGDSANKYAYRKNGIRLQLLDANQRVLVETTLNSSITQEVTYLQQGAEASCKYALPSNAPIPFPAGFTPGLYIRFFDITDPNPDITPGNRGWGGPLGTAGAYGRIQFNDRNLPRYDRCGMVVKGYYIARGPETLHLTTQSDDGIYVEFNKRQVLRDWNIHATRTSSSGPIAIPSAGIYPFELRYYEWQGGAACNFQYRINDESEMRSDVSSRFAYKPAEVQQEEAQIQARIRATEQAKLAQLVRPVVAPRPAPVAAARPVVAPRPVVVPARTATPAPAVARTTVAVAARPPPAPAARAPVAAAARPAAPSPSNPCGTLGKQEVRNGTMIRTYTKAECDRLGGVSSGNGECIKKTGGSFSWDCRNAPVAAPVAAPPPVNAAVAARLGVTNKTLAAAPPAAPRPFVAPLPRPPPGKATITYAYYGTAYNSRGRAVTSAVQQKQRTVPGMSVTSNTLGGDPVPRMAKTLWIDYIPPNGRVSKRMAFRENQTFNFSILT